MLIDLNENQTHIASLLSAIVSLSAVIVYLYMSFSKKIKDKDDAIMKVMEEHRDDIKEGNKDLKAVVDNFAHFMSQIERIVGIKK